VKESLEYFQLVLYILCVTKFVTSLITVLQALLCENLKGKEMDIKHSFA